MPLLPLLEQAQIKPFDSSFGVSHWQDAAATEDIATVPTGYKYVITGVIVQCRRGESPVLGRCQGG